MSENRPRNKAELIQNLLNKIEDQVSQKEFKASIADLIRLLQLQKDLEEEQPREITVTWIEPPETENAPVR